MKFLITFIIFFIISYAKSLFSGQIEEFLKAKNAFDNGSYLEAINRFKELLEGEPPKLTSRHLRIEAHQYLGAAYIIVGKIKEGREQFEELLAIDPEFQMEPALFPTSVLDIFSEVKQKVMERRRKIEELEKERLEKKCLERLKKVKHKEERIVIEKHHRWISFLPFGIGQFQNGEFTKGYIFLAVESLFLTVSIVTWSIMQYLPNGEYCPREFSVTQCQDIERTSEILTYINWGSLISLSIAVIWGIVDALINYTPQRIIKKETKYIPLTNSFTKNKKSNISFNIDKFLLYF